MRSYVPHTRTQSEAPLQRLDERATEQEDADDVSEGTHRGRGRRAAGVRHRGHGRRRRPGCHTHRQGKAGRARRLRPRERQEGHGRADQARRHRHADPGVDFTTIGKAAKAYFDCVNDNGGINGRPIKYILYTEQLNPAQEAALARKLIESDKVVGVVGNTSFAECGTNWKYYKSKGFVVIGAGVQAECYSTPSFARSNMGPRYSNVGARRRSSGRDQEARDRLAGHDLRVRGRRAGARREEGGHPGQDLPDPPAGHRRHLAADPDVPVRRRGGGILIDFTPDTAPAFMKAAIAQGIVDKVKWGSSTPIANTFMAAQFPQFDGHLWINQEFSNVDPKVGPDTALMFQILKKYAPKIAPQAFAQMGFMDGKFATNALLSIKGPVTAQSYNAAVKNLKNQKTDMLCKPFYVGNLPYHIPNNWDITVDYKKGKVVVKEKCFAIAAVDKSISQTRAWEKKFKLNGG
jgi:branched-chain amino acid transport system substrate-binding protein